MTATAREIAQQPALWRECAATVRPYPDEIPERIILTGAGTSAFIGQIVAPGLARTLGRQVEAIATTDLVSSPRLFLADDIPTLLVSFARSGDSPESLAAVQLADQCLSEVRHLVITCNAGGALAVDRAGRTDSVVLTMPTAANDAGFAMTSSFTCMLLSAQLALGGADPAVVDQLAVTGEKVLADAYAHAAELADRGFDRVVYLGSGPLLGLAREAALKMLELTAGQVATWFDSPLGFRHGPKAVLTDRTLVVVFPSADRYTRQYDDDIIAQLGPDVVTADPVLPELDDSLRALVYVLPAQVIALRFSLAHGLDPDNPFPDGEVNRVVRGVRIHPLPAP